MKFTYTQIMNLGLEIIDGDRGKNYPHQNEFSETGYCLFLSANNVTKSGFNFSSVVFIDKTKDAMLRNGRLERGDIVITTRGTVGNVAYYDFSVPFDRLRINSGMLIIRNHGSNDMRYLYYVFRSAWFQAQIKAAQTGSAQPQLPKSLFSKMSIPLPDVPTQRKIASVLSALDAKIELNNRINDNLQAQAMALFIHYYEQANNAVPFTDCVQVLGGGTPKTGESSYWNGDIAFFTPKDVGMPYTLATEKSITESGLAHCNSRLYPANTVFVTARGTVGKVAMAGVPMAMNQSCYALVGRSIEQLLTYFYTLVTVERLQHKASGAVFDAITTRDFEFETIFKLSDEDTEAFLSIATPIFQKILANTMENQKLAGLRDTLLPKLMSGEIDVSDVQL